MAAKVKVHAWIEEIPKELTLPSPGPAEELVVEADSYEDGIPLIEAALPPGWRVMNLGRLDDVPAEVPADVTAESGTPAA
ncbi:hypothetical protein [Promicromonospora sp. NFX87]|uniref:hypothetical protein n=1 Tax=Promicromonospora sp. NFX87 TaxID=3402691 RepID=UPI003AFB71B6